ncbi:transcriptional regulator [Nonomuraea sp. WAC 01424]|uniref:winged helix-turn-helix domain-containing protein n=1 Tax=Nonomuraea sp. WAC 01424 TaxID=2203200 RepID=UPI000F782AD6|nr:helix-turn-helix domain-containing protein [Nonomuraea sp. WAC 01424]RSM95613.1 transcriptional regulator [Nonomuraea sp. WAC 01424]
MEEQYKISDPQVLKVVAHPLRVRLLGLLRSDGPATASELGRKVGESSGSTSYHLRELFKYGFIEEDPERGDGRERRWRARHRYTSWDSGELIGTDEGREAVRIMRMRQVETLARVVQDYDERDWSPEWVSAAGMSDDFVELPPAGLKELDEKVEELIRDLAARHAGDPEARQVHVWIGGFPRAKGRAKDRAENPEIEEQDR